MNPILEVNGGLLCRPITLKKVLLCQGNCETVNKAGYVMGRMGTDRECGAL